MTLGAGNLSHRGGPCRRPKRRRQRGGHGAGAVATVQLGLGRIVVSETEAPNMLVNLV